MRAGAKQLESRLIADLHPAAGHERHPAAEIGELGALGEIQLGACRAHLVVEMMDLRVFLFADVAVLKLFGVGPAKAGHYRRRSAKAEP